MALIGEVGMLKFPSSMNKEGVLGTIDSPGPNGALLSTEAPAPTRGYSPFPSFNRRVSCLTPFLSNGVDFSLNVAGGRNWWVPASGGGGLRLAPCSFWECPFTWVP